MKLRQGYVFTGVCDSVHLGGGHVRQGGACMAMGAYMVKRGVCVTKGGMHDERGHAWQRGGAGACVSSKDK